MHPRAKSVFILHIIDVTDSVSFSNSPMFFGSLPTPKLARCPRNGLVVFQEYATTDIDP